MEDVYGFEGVGVDGASEAERRRSRSGVSDAAAASGPVGAGLWKA